MPPIMSSQSPHATGVNGTGTPRRDAQRGSPSAARRGSRRGALEVETDLLLGVDDVLLPAGVHVVAGDVVAGDVAVPDDASAGTPRLVEPKPAPEMRTKFDAELFNPKSGSSAGAPRPAPPAREVAAEPGRPAFTARATAPSPAPTSGAEAKAVLADSIAPPAGGTRAERLAALQQLHARECPHCTQTAGWTQLVFGEGNPEAEFVFVGEAPGETEDQTGRPFVGPAGDKLNGMIRAMGLERADVYIANVLKARPPGNRTPLAPEVERCGPYLLAQLAIIRPKVIVTLGGPATKLLLGTELGITRLRGVAARVTLGLAEGSPFEVPVMPTFHPAYLLRNYTVETRGQVWSDLQKALELAGRPVPPRAS
jgi:uracil-DNA glycosylase family 4